MPAKNRPAVWRRRLLIGLGLVVIVLLAAAEGVRRYASTQLVGALAEIYGGRVEADTARADWRNTTLQGVRFYDADGQDVVLSIEQLGTDLSLWDLVTGRTTPNHLVLTQPELRLRFDEAGRLLTRLPESEVGGGELPDRIDLNEGRVVVSQQGRADSEIAGVSGQLSDDDGALAIALTIEDQSWGQWNVDGHLEPASGKGSITAASRQLSVSPELLRTLPLVPAKIWDHVVAEGPFSAKLVANLGSERVAPSFQAAFEWDNAELAFPSLDVKLADSRGTLAVENEIAQFNLNGAVADGTVSAAGKIELGEAPRLELALKPQGVDVAQLPPDWPMPEAIKGRLTGAADIQLALHDDRIQAAAKGRATLSDAAIAGVPVEPVEIELHGGQAQSPGEKVELSGEATLRLRMREAPAARLIEEFANTGRKGLPEVQGLLSVDLQLTVPLATANDPATYTAAGAISSDEVEVQGIELTDLGARVDLSAGILRLDQVEAGLPGSEPGADGRIAAAVEIGLAPKGWVALRLSIDRASLELASRFIELEQKPRGLISLDMNAAAPRSDVHKPSAWQAKGRIAIPQLQLQERLISDVAADVETMEGVLHFSSAKATVAEMAIAATAAVKLAAPFEYQVNVDLPASDLAALFALADVEPPVTMDGRLETTAGVQGSLDPFTWSADGSALIKDLHLKDWSFDVAEFHWRLDRQQVRLTDLIASAYLGAVTAEVTLPLTQDAPLETKGEFRNIRLELLPEEAVQSLGELTGGIDGSFSLAGRDLATLVGDVRLESSEVNAGSIPLEDLSIQLSVRKGELDYRGTAEAVDGQITVAGEMTYVRDGQALAQGKGRIEAEGLQLRRLAEWLGPREDLPLAGLATLELEYSHEGLKPVGRGRVLIRDLRWTNRGLAPLVDGELLLTEGELRFPEIAARLGDGSLRASLSLDLQRLGRGTYSLAFDRMSAEDLLFAWPDLAEQIDGPLDVRLRGAIGRRVTGTGAIAMAQGSIAGVEVTGMRLPVQFAYTPAESRGELQIPESTIQAARGRIVGGAELTWGRGVQLSATARLVGLELQSLARSAGNVVQLGGGRISGRAAFASQDLRTISDLKGAFELTLAQTQALQFPVLRSVARYVTPAAPSSVSFQRGELKGRLARGIVQIERFALIGSDTRLLAEGTITLAGRLALDVTAQRGGQPLAAPLLRRIAVRVIQAQTVPLTLLTEANTLLNDRLVFLRVSGTLRSPTIQLRPAPQLGQEALRFFLVRAAGLQ